MGVGKFPGTGVATHVWTEALGGFGCIHGVDFTEPYPRHVHARLVIALIERGAFQLVTRDHAYDAGPGDVVVINPFRVHGERWNNASFRAIYLSAGNLGEAFPRTGGSRAQLWFERPVVHDPDLARHLRTIHEAVQESAPASTVEARTAALLALLRSSRSASGPQPMPSSIAVALDRIHGTLAQAPSIGALSRIAGRSPYHFLRSFHRTIGLPPHAYLDQLRVAHAKELLVDGRTLSDTARALGYCDQSHFTRSFRRSALVTPGQYLNMVRGRAPA
jgi:AraC-like DNA-binding protein